MNKIQITKIDKISITVTRRQLWNNYVNCWRDNMWEGMHNGGYNEIIKVGNVLLSGERLNIAELRKLFRSGDTLLLMGDLMAHIDTGTEILREIIVIDEDDGKEYIIFHNDIVF